MKIRSTSVNAPRHDHVRTYLLPLTRRTRRLLRRRALPRLRPPTRILRRSFLEVGARPLAERRLLPLRWRRVRLECESAKGSLTRRRRLVCVGRLRLERPCGPCARGSGNKRERWRRCGFNYGLLGFRPRASWTDGCGDSRRGKTRSGNALSNCGFLRRRAEGTGVKLDRELASGAANKIYAYQPQLVSRADLRVLCKLLRET